MSAPVRAGDLLAGKYLVERVIGAGGMGVVVSAHHVHLEERVAIKFLLPEALSDPNLVKRFLREGKAASKIRSEHVARVYDVGTLENGGPYIVMEFLEGSDLAALIKARGPLHVTTAVEYLLQACEAIAEAHAVGIVHRDIKPSNLFFASRRDGSSVVKVIDFGISKMTAGPDAGMDITKTAEARGSMLFMSPEQMVSPKNADPRMDIWALGVSLHYLLARSYPFQATSVPELCAMILQREPTPLRSVRPDISPRLEACVLRCLRKAPDERYANVADLAAALLEFGPPSASISVERARRMLSSRMREPQSSMSEIIASSGRTDAPVAAQALPTGPPVALRAGAVASTRLSGTEPLPSKPDHASIKDGTDGRWAERTGTENVTRKLVRRPLGSLFMPIVIGTTITVILGIAAVGLAWRYSSSQAAAQASSVSPEGVNPAAFAGARSSTAPLAPSPLASGLPSGRAAPGPIATHSVTARASAEKPVAVAPSARPSSGKGSGASLAAPRATSEIAAPPPAAAPSTAPTPSQATPPEGGQKPLKVLF
ncbi:MAG TPA: serine/threonine-protein kinase [Polyangiaceae bacterium]|nr:serine/threonine-protein kinase [Polyangiaceae bacterium]